MNGTTDKVKGRVEEAVGVLTNDKKLKNRGKMDQAAGNVKDAIGKTIDKAVSVVNRDKQALVGTSCRSSLHVSASDPARFPLSVLTKRGFILARCFRPGCIRLTIASWRQVIKVCAVGFADGPIGVNGSNREENHAAKGTQCSLDLNRIGAVDDGRRTFRVLDVFSVGCASRLRRCETAGGGGTDRRSDRIEFEHLAR